MSFPSNLRGRHQGCRATNWVREPSSRDSDKIGQSYWANPQKKKKNVFHLEIYQRRQGSCFRIAPRHLVTERPGLDEIMLVCISSTHMEVEKERAANILRDTKITSKFKRGLSAGHHQGKH